jgi:hypothetical protein
MVHVGACFFALILELEIKLRGTLEVFPASSI